MVAGLVLAGCGIPEDSEEETSVPTIQEVKDARTEEWMGLPGVVGVGIGRCEEEDCIRVLLSRPSPEAEEAIPERVEGYLVELEVTGPVRPRTPPDTAR